MRCSYGLRRRSVPVLFTLLSCSQAAVAQSTTGWRGDGSGRFPDAKPVLEWSPTRNVVWKTELPGASPASPVLVGERLFVTSDPFLLLCLHASDGEVLWQRGHTAADLGPAGVQAPDVDTRHNPDGDAGSAASTPVSDGKHVFAIFANGIASCHDLDGERKWGRFVERPKTGFGHSSSPTLVDGKLIVHFVDLVALDAETGKPQWRVELPASHASPVVTKIGDVEVVVHPAGSILRATDGEVLAENLFRLTQSSPVVHAGVIYAHENGTLKAFALPQKADEPFAVRQLWSAATTRGQYQIASPAVHDGLVHTVNIGGILQAIDAKTGSAVYRTRLPLGSRVYASVQSAGGLLFVSDQTGKTIVVLPGRQFEQAAVNTLDFHPTSPFFAGKRQYVRTYRHVFCVGQ